MCHRRPRSIKLGSRSAPGGQRPSPAKRRALAKLDEQKRRATQTVAKELVPKMEAAQAEHDQQVAELTEKLQAATDAAERAGLEEQIKRVRTAHVSALKELEATAHDKLAAIEITHEAAVAKKLLPPGREAQDSRSPAKRTKPVSTAIHIRHAEIYSADEH